MKWIVSILSAAFLLFSLTACGNGHTDPETTDTSGGLPASSEAGTAGRRDNEKTILIAYFTRTGNTRTIAEMVAAETGGTLFQVETVIPYPDDYDTCTAQAQQERDENARPALSTHIGDMERYDVVFIGYPIWWGTMPMAMFTFLEEYNLSGKTVIPFCTHGGSGLGRSVGDIRQLAPASTIPEGLAIAGSSAEKAGPDVKAWIDGLDIIR